MESRSLHVVVAALQELGERTRDVFMLDRLEHMKHAEIATLFGISVSAVEKSTWPRLWPISPAALERSHE